MDAFLNATTYQYGAYLQAASGDIWHVWFGNNNQPLIERLTDYEIVGLPNVIAHLALATAPRSPALPTKADP